VRLDLLLKYLCLVKTRNVARKGILKESVRVGGKAVKPSREIREGDIIHIRYPGRVLVIEILEIPGGQVPKARCGEFYRVIRESEV
jgi:ribosomal 50S subunit-recycling heat shock protein